MGAWNILQSRFNNKFLKNHSEIHDLALISLFFFKVYYLDVGILEKPVYSHLQLRHIYDDCENMEGAVFWPEYRAKSEVKCCKMLCYCQQWILHLFGRWIIITFFTKKKPQRISNSRSMPRFHRCLHSHKDSYPNSRPKRGKMKWRFWLSILFIVFQEATYFNMLRIWCCFIYFGGEPLRLLGKNKIDLSDISWGNKIVVINE